MGSDGASVEKEELGRVCVHGYRVQEEGGCTWLYRVQGVHGYRVQEEGGCTWL